MKTNTKSSITLPPEELRLVVSLQAQLTAKSKATRAAPSRTAGWFALCGLPRPLLRDVEDKLRRLGDL